MKSERCKFCSTIRIETNGKRELKNDYSEFCVECEKWLEHKDNVVCPFCEQSIKELPKGLELKEIIKSFKNLTKLLTKKK